MVYGAVSLVLLLLLINQNQCSTCTRGDSWTELREGYSHNRDEYSLHLYSPFDHTTELIQYRLNKTSSWRGSSYLQITNDLYSGYLGQQVGSVGIYYSLSGDRVKTSSYVYLETVYLKTVYLERAVRKCYNWTALQQYGRVPQQISMHLTSDAADIITLDGNFTVSFTDCTDSQYTVWETLVKNSERNSGGITALRQIQLSERNNADSLTIETRNQYRLPTCCKPTISGGAVSPSNATIDYLSSYSVTCNTGYAMSNSSLSTLTCGAGGTLSDSPTCDIDRSWTKLAEGYNNGYFPFDPTTELVQYRLNQTSSWQESSSFVELSTTLYSAENKWLAHVSIYYTRYYPRVPMVSLTTDGGYCHNMTALQEYGRIPQQISMHLTSDAVDIFTLDGNVTVSFTDCTDSQYTSMYSSMYAEWETLVNARRIALVSHDLSSSADSLNVEARTQYRFGTCSKPTISGGTVWPTDATIEYNSYLSTYSVTCKTGYAMSNPSLSTLTCGAGGTLSDSPTCDTVGSWTKITKGYYDYLSPNFYPFDPTTDLVQYQLNNTSWCCSDLEIFTYLYSGDNIYISSYIGYMDIYYALSNDNVTDSYVGLYSSRGGVCYNRTALQEYGRVPHQVSWHLTSDAADILTLDGNVTVSFTDCTDSQYTAWETLVNSGRIALVKHDLPYRTSYADSLNVEARTQYRFGTCSKPTISGGAVSPADATIDYLSSYSVTCNTSYAMSNSSLSTLTCGAGGTLSDSPTCDIQHCWNESEQQRLIGTKVAKLYDLENAKKVCKCLSCSGISCQFKKGNPDCHLYSEITRIKNDQQAYTSYRYGPCNAQ